MSTSSFGNTPQPGGLNQLRSDDGDLLKVVPTDSDTPYAEFRNLILFSTVGSKVHIASAKGSKS